MRTSNLTVSLALVALAGLPLGCTKNKKNVYVGGPAAPAGVVQSPTHTVVTPAAPSAVVAVQPAPPPPAPAEVRTAAPASGYVWVPGAYEWVDGKWEWKSGHWLQPAQPSAVWEPGHWQSVPGGYTWQPGRWR